MAYDDVVDTEAAQDVGDGAGRLRLARAGAYGANGDNLCGRAQHHVVRAKEYEGGSRGGSAGGAVHHVVMRDVAISEDDIAHATLLNDTWQVLLRENGDTLGISRAGQLGGVEPPLDVGDLGRGEGDHLIGGVVAEEDVEVVEIASRRPHDDDLARTCHVATPSQWRVAAP